MKRVMNKTDMLHRLKVVEKLSSGTVTYTIECNSLADLGVIKSKLLRNSDVLSLEVI